MNPWQAIRQIAFLVAAAKWPASPNDPILTGGCQMSEDLDGNFLGSVGMDGLQHGFSLPASPANQNDPPVDSLPFARVHFVEGRLDTEVPGRYQEARFRIWVTCGRGGISGDPLNKQGGQTHGTDSLVGSAFGPDGQGGSVGRGLEDVVQAVAQAVLGGGRFNASAYGIQGFVVDSPSAKPTDGVNVVSRPVDVVVTDCTVQPYYAPVRRLTSSGSGAGTIALAWAPAAARFDSVSVPTVRYAAGNTPPPTPTSGLAVGGVGSGGVTFSPGAGTWSVSVFSPYDSTMPGPPAAANNYSSPVSLTVTV